MDKITVIATASGRIDKVLVAVLATTTTPLSRTKIQELITARQVEVNDQVVHQNYLVQKGETIIVTLPPVVPTELVPMTVPLTVLYEDDMLLVIDKPNNLVVHPAPGHTNDTLVNVLIARSKAWSTVSGELRPGIVHRIDRQTTGTLIIAKNDFIHQQLQEQIQTKQLQRRYLALVHGNIVENRAKIDAPIGRDLHDRKKMVVTAKNSKKAVTNILVIERFNDYTYIECELETGRTHQIRAHLKYINHPIVGDPLYGMSVDKQEPFGQYLHAYQLTFIHPITKLPITVSAALPVEFENKLIALRAKG
ncbi:RluA family pseudouridine synthase [Spiroplasma sp. SV19]|uniref:RluA family pseudouridine synthase n=1 Tax=Spiroplasma sp. SV19 TaxID=2570468 RepID=UPI0024B6F578|nr:RluA family pseudouridine synthase [Spiroplasma sp. SV19]WHQ36360.1 RluA family pseudouridine synthase [Spiroplasma sp. SV19]